MKKLALVIISISVNYIVKSQDQTVNGNLTVDDGTTTITPANNNQSGILKINEYRGGALLDFSEVLDAGVLKVGHYGLIDDRVELNGGTGGIGGEVLGYNDGEIKFKLSSSGISYINGTNVGIGTSSPATTLEVKNSSYKQLLLSNNGTEKFYMGSVWASVGSFISNNSFYKSNNRYLALDEVANGIQFKSSGDVKLFTNSGLTVNEEFIPTPRLTVKANGKVGIGTDDPIEKFQIGNSFLFHDGGHQIISFLHSPLGTDLSDSKYAAEIRFDSSQGNLRIGTSSTKTNYATSHLTINKLGNVGIGTLNPDEKLSVNGKIHTKEVKVDLNGWSDFVFDKGYDLPTLKEVENHINKEGHLKDIPSEKEVLENGIHLGEMNSKLLQKIEELTLYIIEQDKKIKDLEEQNLRIEKNEKENTQLAERLNALEHLIKK